MHDNRTEQVAAEEDLRRPLAVLKALRQLFLTDATDGSA